MKITSLVATSVASFVLMLTASGALAASQTLIGNADGDLSVNHSAAILARAMAETIPQLGVSGIDVKTTVMMDLANPLLTVEIVTDDRTRATKIDVEKKIDRKFECHIFTVTAEATALFVAKARQTDELQNGTRRDTVIRADCKDQRGQKTKLVISYDNDSYSLFINDDTLWTSTPRFDVVFGPIPKKKGNLRQPSAR